MGSSKVCEACNGTGFVSGVEWKHVIIRRVKNKTTFYLDGKKYNSSDVMPIEEIIEIPCSECGKQHEI